MYLKNGSVVVEYPPWVEGSIDWHQRLPTDEAKMQLVLNLTLENLRRKTGGPFAAAIFQRGEHRLVSVGVNMVQGCKCCVAHAPIIALIKANAAEETHNFSDKEGDGFELFADCEPCVGCAQFILDAGISRLVYGASGKVKEKKGMEHGINPMQHLRECGVEIVSGVLGHEATKLIEQYDTFECGNYNPRRSTK